MSMGVNGMRKLEPDKVCVNLWTFKSCVCLCPGLHDISCLNCIDEQEAGFRLTMQVCWCQFRECDQTLHPNVSICA